MSSGCNSCKNLDPKNKKPGKTSGYLFFCKAKGTYVNAAKDDCKYYEHDEGRSSYEVNDIYHDSYYYNDMINNAGCNSCAYLDEKKKNPGKGGGALYFCSKKNTYVNPSDNSCENYSNGYRDNYIENQIYRDGKDYKEDTDSTSPLFYLFILALMVIIALVYELFYK